MADWNSSDDEIMAYLSENLKGQGDHIVRSVTRSQTREKTLLLKSAMARELDFEIIKTVMASPEKYRNWMLDGINIRANGNPYYVLFEDVIAPAPGRLDFKMRLDFPVFKAESTQPFNLKIEKEDRVLRAYMTAHADPNRILEEMVGQMRIYQAPDDPTRVWIYLEGSMTLIPWLLFEALPVRLLSREYLYRMSLILRNSQKEEEKY